MFLACFINVEFCGLYGINIMYFKRIGTKLKYATMKLTGTFYIYTSWIIHVQIDNVSNRHLYILWAYIIIIIVDRWLLKKYVLFL